MTPSGKSSSRKQNNERRLAMERMKAFFNALRDNEIYKGWFKNPLTYVAGAVLLSVLQIATLAVSRNPWGVSGVFANWGAWMYEALGGSVDKWYYFSSAGAQNT